MGLAPYKKMFHKGPSFFHRERTLWEGAGYEPGRGSSPEFDHAGILLLDFPVPRTLNQVLLHTTTRMNLENMLNEPDTNDQLLYDSMYMKCPDKANPQRQKQIAVTRN